MGPLPERIGPFSFHARTRKDGRGSGAHDRSMTTAEIESFVGRNVSVTTNASNNPITGKLVRLDRSAGPTSYHVLSVDGEVPPVLLDAAEIIAVDG